ncbi:MAG: hypothetical protein Ct9H300mP7_1060 [Verrucomicrobiota bacterium]|nr:MAG: hypothetical protein Ct9H300mP7_1060 [Verrucomicrobiota bacterium]
MAKYLPQTAFFARFPFRGGKWGRVSGPLWPPRSIRGLARLARPHAIAPRGKGDVWRRYVTVVTQGEMFAVGAQVKVIGHRVATCSLSKTERLAKRNTGWGGERQHHLFCLRVEHVPAADGGSLPRRSGVWPSGTA